VIYRSGWIGMSSGAKTSLRSGDVTKPFIASFKFFSSVSAL